MRKLLCKREKDQRSRSYNVVSWVAFAISALLSIRLFVSLATDAFSWVLLAALALCLECGKLESIRLFNQKRKNFFAGLLCLLVGLSLVASAGSALVLINERNARTALAERSRSQSMDAYSLALSRVRSLDEQIAQLGRKLDATPAEWAGTVKGLRGELEALRLERNEAAKDFAGSSQGTSTMNADMFSVFARESGIREGVLLFVFLLLVSGAIEALILAGSIGARPGRNDCAESQKRKNFSRRGRPPKPLDADRLLPEFTRRMLRSVNDQGYAGASRDSVAREMGLTGWDGKKLYGLAVERGLLEPCGHRTRQGRYSVSA